MNGFSSLFGINFFFQQFLGVCLLFVFFFRVLNEMNEELSLFNHACLVSVSEVSISSCDLVFVT